MTRRSTIPVSLMAAMVLTVSGCAAPSSTRNSVLLGAGAGGLAGAGLGCLTAYDIDKDDLGTYTYGCVTGAAVGAVIGAALGYRLAPPAAPPPPPASPPDKEKLMLSGGGPFSGRSARAIPPTQPPKEKLTLRGVRFSHDQADIRPEDQPLLDEAADTLNAHPNVTVYVDGYCDTTGKDNYNNKLSLKRAQAVAKYLQSRGVESTRLAPRGFGRTHFVASNDTEEGRAQNRRVELVPTN